MKAQQYIPILWLRSIKSCFTIIKDLWTLFRSGLFNEESCFPELPRKNKFQRAIQLIWYLLRYGERMWQYNLYGLDVKPFKAIKEYIANQLKHDKESDQLALFYPQDPFMGNK